MAAVSSRNVWQVRKIFIRLEAGPNVKINRLVRFGPRWPKPLKSDELVVHSHDMGLGVDSHDLAVESHDRGLIVRLLLSPSTSCIQWSCTTRV